MSATTRTNTIDLLREAGMLLRDPANRDPESMAQVATELEVIAARAAEWGVHNLLEIEARTIPAKVLPSVYRRLTEEDRQHNLRVNSMLKRREQAYRLLAEFLRVSGFDTESVT